jgi:amino acid permease
MLLTENFLGFENLDGFNSSLSQEKVELIEKERKKVLKNNDKKNVVTIIYIFLICFPLLTYHHFLEKILDNTFLNILTIIFFLPLWYLYKISHKNKFYLNYLDYLLKRNEELKNNSQISKHHWSQLLF